MFLRLRFLQFDTNPAKSALIGIKMLRDFHADVCESCGRSTDWCRQRKIKRVLACVRRGCLINGGYITGDQVTKEVASMRCRR